MKAYVLAFLLVASTSIPVVVVDLPVNTRQSNWLGGPKNNGSCVWASLVSVLRWQHRPQTAEYLRQHCGGGANWGDVVQVFDRLGVRYAQTVGERDVSFLEWAIRTRRGCAVCVESGAHMVCLVALNSEYAGILDNNSVGEIKWIPRQEFLNDWYASYSWAVTVVYVPSAPPVSQ